MNNRRQCCTLQRNNLIANWNSRMRYEYLTYRFNYHKGNISKYPLQYDVKVIGQALEKAINDFGFEI